MAVRVAKQVQSFNGIPSLISKIHAENFDISKCKKAVVLIPGNPGIIRFYDSFLESLFIECKGEIPMFGIQHAGLVYYCTLFNFYLNVQTILTYLLIVGITISTIVQQMIVNLQLSESESYVIKWTTCALEKFLIWE